MTIEVKYIDSNNGSITVQTGFWDENRFEMESCNHAGKTVEESSTFDGYSTGFYYQCDKCEEIEIIEENE